MWLLETFSPSCPAPALFLYLQQAAARVEELPLLDIQHQRSEEVSCLSVGNNDQNHHLKLYMCDKTVRKNI